eukprot:gene5400-5634_t
MFQLLQGYGVSKFQRAQYEVAARFIKAAVEFAEESAKALLMRQMAVCHMGLQQTDKALACCAAADSYQHGQVATAFIRFKLLLMQGAASEEVLQVVHSMTACSDFNTDMLCVSAAMQPPAVFKEANGSAGANAVAKAALQLLYTQLLEQGEPNTGNTGGNLAVGRVSELAVLRTLVSMTIEELEHCVMVLKSGPGDFDAPAPEQMPEGPGQLQEGRELASSAAAACILQLGEQMTMLCAKLRRHGLSGAMAGEEEDSAAQHLEWFSLCCWNAALSAAGEHHCKFGFFKGQPAWS